MITIATASGDTGFEPGATAVFDVTWNLPSPPDEVVLRVLWEADGAGESDQTLALERSIEVSAPEDRQSVALPLPRNPLSYTGKLVSIRWFVEAEARPVGTRNRLAIVIGPGGVGVEAHV